MLVVMWNYHSRNMTERNLFINTLLLGFAIIFSVISQCSSVLSDKRLCYDRDCSEPVSLARTTIKYSPSEPGLLGFDTNVIVKVYSKGAGSRLDLWGVEINGKRGYASKTFLKEYKILRKNLQHVVSTNLLDANSTVSIQPEQNEQNIKVDGKDVKVSTKSANNLISESTKELQHKEIDATPTFQVIDGTKFHFNQDVPSVQSPSISEAIKPMVVPNGHGVVDDSTINNKIESNIFIDNDKVSEHASVNKVENGKERLPDKVDINDFVRNFGEKLDLPEVTGVQIPPLNNSETSDKIEHKTENIKADSVPDEQSGRHLKQDIASNISKTVTSNENKQALDIEDKTAAPIAKEGSLNISEIHAHSDTISSNVQIEKSIDTVGSNDVQSSANESTVVDNSIKPDIQITESSVKHETKGPQSSEGETVVPTSYIIADAKSAEKPENVEEKGVQPSEDGTKIATSDAKPGSQVAESSDKLLITETRSSENKTVVTTSDIKTDAKSAEKPENVEEKGVQPSEDGTKIATSDAKPGSQVAESSDKLLITESRSSENKTVVTTSDIKTDAESSEKPGNVVEKGVEPSENGTKIATSDAKPGSQVAESSDKLLITESRSSENKTVVTTSNIKTDAESSEKPENVVEKGVQPSENGSKIAVSDAKSSSQVIESSDKFLLQETRSSENETVVTTSNIKTDAKSAEKPENVEEKGVQPSENTKVDVQSLRSSEKIDSRDKQSLENISTDTETAPYLQDTKAVTINNTEFDGQSTEGITKDENSDSKSEEAGSAVNIDKIDAKDSQFVEAIAANIKELAPIENVTQLETERNESENEGESKSAEDLSKYNSNGYISPLFFQLNAKNEAPVTTPPYSIETSIQSTETISELDTKYVKSDSNIENVASVTDTAVETEPDLNIEDTVSLEEDLLQDIIHEVQDPTPDICTSDVECSLGSDIQNDFPHHEEFSRKSENAIMEGIQLGSNYWITLMYLSVTAIATLIFSLGYYSIENMSRDRQLIARINKLEKDLLISEAEYTTMSENLNSTKEKLKRMEDESFGSDEMVLSLRADLEASQCAKTELEDQVALLEKDLESATEAGLELEKMLREILASNNEVNPLAQSVEDLQTRLNAQQAANESLTNALALKTQENESLSAELACLKKKYEELEVEFSRVTENLKLEVNNKNSIVQILNDKVQEFEMQIKEISTQRVTLQKELKGREVEVKDLLDVISKLKSNNLDLDKLYDVSHIKAEATVLHEERNELKIRLAEVEGAHNLLDEHMKVIKEEIATLSEQCKTAEKEKKDAETRLEVLTNFFEEKEAQRQKEEAIWLQQQGEVVSTVERIQTMQNEIQNYKQQTDMLKREILDQEREYKNQMSLLETKAHEQWVIARQVERRLEESKVEAGQLRNRLTLIEKNINDVDSEAKLHRLEANGETTTSPPLFIGAEPSSSPIMFSGSTSVPPPPPPSYLHSLFPPYLPPPLPNPSGVPPYEVSQRLPPLGARLSSPPPMPPLHPPASSRYDNASSPPPMSPHLLPPYNHRSPPPPFSSDMHSHPPPHPGSILPSSLGAPHLWGEESLLHPRNSGFHPPQRQRVRNHKGSLHSSGESLDKSHHSKV